MSPLMMVLFAKKRYMLFSEFKTKLRIRVGNKIPVTQNLGRVVEISARNAQQILPPSIKYDGDEMHVHLAL